MTTTTVTKTESTTAADEAARKREAADKAAPAKAETVKEKGELKVAVNLITMTGDDGKPADVLPGALFRPAAVDLEFLTKAEAIREPTDGERALFEKVEASAKAANATADETLG